MKEKINVELFFLRIKNTFLYTTVYLIWILSYILFVLWDLFTFCSFARCFYYCKCLSDTKSYKKPTLLCNLNLYILVSV